MPSPIAHWTVGLVVCRSLWPIPTGRGETRSIPWLWLLPTSLLLSLLPDAGSVAGVLSGDFGRFHNSWEHSLLVGVGCALIGAAVLWVLGVAGGWRWLAMILVCFELHVLMDLFTVGRGVKILWPFSELRYSPPVKLFYGVHWSDGWASIRHLWTLLTEVAFAGVVVAAAAVWLRRRRRAISDTVAAAGGTADRR